MKPPAHGLPVEGHEKEEIHPYHNEHTFVSQMIRGLGKLSKYPLPVPPETRPWQEMDAFMDTLDTLDLVLFSCPLSWYSMQLQGGRWSHVGMIYKRDDVYLKHRDNLEPDNPAKLLIFESIFGKEEERFAGVDLADAKKRLHVYFDPNHPEIKKWGKKQYIGIRKLNIERTPELLQAVEREVIKHNRKPYEMNVMELLKSLIDTFDDSPFPITKNTVEGADSLFCSELVAYMYQAARVIQPFHEGGTIPNEFSPCDFCSDFSYKLPLLKGTLDKEVIFGYVDQKEEKEVRVEEKPVSRHFNFHTRRKSRRGSKDPKSKKAR